MNQETGTLYGIGVGPGDPDLIPVKAVKILGNADIIFAAASTKNQYSRAVEIARPHIPPAVRIKMLSFPMTRDPQIRHRAWKENTQIILEALRQGLDAVFLTLGDCLTYATYGYILREMSRMAPEINIVTIPGITSYQAAAARVNLPLVEDEQSLLIVSGAQGGNNLRQACRLAENVVIMKAYRNTGDIVAALSETGMVANSVAVSNLGMKDEKVIPDIDRLADRKPSYWTLVIAKK